MIGILDSGLAGLDLTRRLMAGLPQHRFIYFGDTAHGPYDDKSPEAILRFAARGARFLAEKGARRIVLACHATSCAAAEALAALSPVPVIDVAGLAAAAAVRVSRHGRIGVMGARATVRSGAYMDRIRLLAPEAAVFLAPCPLIGPLIGEGWLKKPETTRIVKKLLIPLKVRKIDTLILGDAHFPILAAVIQKKIGMRVHLVEPSADLIDRLKDDPAPPPGSPPEEGADFYLSDIPPETERRAAVFMKRRVRFRPAAP